MRKTALLFTLLFASATLLRAQEDAILVSEVIATPNYLIAVISGVLLAFGFQYLLTALSVAIGLTAVPNVKEAYAKSKAQPSDAERARLRGSRYGTPRYVRQGNVTLALYEDDAADEDGSGTDGAPVGVTISTAIGAWNAVTTAISLFLATLLALHLSPVLNDYIALTLALTIWATFFMLLFWLESRFATTAIGGLVSAATSGLKSAGEAVKGMIAPNPVKEVTNAVESTMADLQSHLSDGLDTDKIVDAINGFTKEVDKTVPSYDQLKKDITEIVERGTKAANEGDGSNPAKWTAIQSVIQSAIGSDDGASGGTNQERKEQLKKLMAELKATYEKDGLTADGVKDALKSADIADDTQIDEYMDKITSVFSTSAPQDFSKDGLLKKLQSLVDEGQLSVDELKSGKIRERLAGMDREQVTAMVAANTSLDRAQIDNYVDQAMSVFEMLKAKLPTGVTGESSGGDTTGIAAQAQALIAQYLGTGSGKTAQFDFAAIKNQVQSVLADPQDTVSTVRRRLASMDRDTLVQALIDRTSLSRADIDKAADQIDTMRTDLEGKLHELESQARTTLRQTERKAVIQAEHARKTAVTAAWWLVIAILVSAGGAVLGTLV